jgi:ribosomal protein S13
MKLAINIVQSLLLPKLEKDANFDANQTNIAFWETFTTVLLDFEKNAKTVYAVIYSLGLKDAEKIISKLDTVYISFIKELAENHVLGIRSEAIDYLITSKNSTFEKEVRFFTDLQNAITKAERKRIKTELPKTFDKLSFQLSDDAIALAITKKEREALKEKMNAWDKELVTSEEAPVYSVFAKKEPKVISLSWIKYAVAACLVLGLGVWFFNNQNPGFNPENNVVTIPVKKDTTSKGTITPEIPSEALAEVAIVTKNAPVIESGLGFASNTIKIVENNQKARMASIVTAIEKYRQLLENEFSENKVGDSPRVKALESKISELQNEWVLLNARENHYIFDGKALVLYVSNFAKENSIVVYDDTYYLKKDAEFFRLTIASQPQPYKKESNLEVLEKLDKIYNGY